MKIQIRRLPHGEGLPLPKYMTSGSSGMDLVAAVEETMLLGPGDIVAVPTGLVLAIPEGFEGQVRPRSGLAMRHGLSVPNAPGTIDSDYRGELKVLLINLGKEAFAINRGDRIAQLVFCKVEQARLELVEELSETERNEGGFGHTGKTTGG